MVQLFRKIVWKNRIVVFKTLHMIIRGKKDLNVVRYTSSISNILTIDKHKICSIFGGGYFCSVTVVPHLSLLLSPAPLIRQILYDLTYKWNRVNKTNRQAKENQKHGNMFSIQSPSSRTLLSQFPLEWGCVCDWGRGGEVGRELLSFDLQNKERHAFRAVVMCPLPQMLPHFLKEEEANEKGSQAKSLPGGDYSLTNTFF